MSAIANITDGIYQIFNVAYPSQAADLLYPGGVNGTIGGYANDQSKRDQWQVVNVGNSTSGGRISLTNLEITTYANILQNAVNTTIVVGNPDSGVAWDVNVTLPTSNGGDEYIITHNTDFGTILYAWTLADSRDGTPITTLEYTGPPEKNQLWKFVPVN